MDLKSKDGWLEVVCGCMFAGKTEELIRRINRIKYAKKDIIVFKPIIDDRYDKKQVVSKIFAFIMLLLMVFASCSTCIYYVVATIQK